LKYAPGSIHDGLAHGVEFIRVLTVAEFLGYVLDNFWGIALFDMDTKVGSADDGRLELAGDAQTQTIFTVAAILDQAEESISSVLFLTLVQGVHENLYRDSLQYFSQACLEKLFKLF